MITLFDTYLQDIVFKCLSIIIHGMTLDKLLTTKLSGMTHSYRAYISSVSILDENSEDTAVCKRKRTVETGCM